MVVLWSSLKPGKRIFDGITPRGLIRKRQVTAETKGKEEQRIKAIYWKVNVLPQQFLSMWIVGRELSATNRVTDS